MLHYDYQGREVRLPQERLEHILRQHPFMVGKERTIPETLEMPNEVRMSNQDQRVILYYRWYNTSEIENKFICVVVRTLENDAFVVTAYPTVGIKRGDLVWRKNQ